jgi:hypothetical protein
MADHAPKPTEIAEAAFRRVAATWELARCEPEHIGCDLPDEMDSRFCDEHSNALSAYLETPAEDLWALVGKLRTYHREELHKGGDAEGCLIKALYADAHRLAMQASRSQTTEARHG